MVHFFDSVVERGARSAERSPLLALRAPRSALNTLLDSHSAIMRLEAQEWAGAKEAVPTQPLAADHAFEEKRPVAFLNLAEGAHRRECVADQLPIDRHDAGGASQRGQLRERGTITPRARPRPANRA